jgi:apolipoprotein D and lipocalin family protein
MPPLRAALAAAVALAPAASLAEHCPHPPPSTTFSNFSYDGTWYEIGKAQTKGGAVFESSCVCTEIIVTPAGDGTPTDQRVLNSCRHNTPEGAFLNATSTLVNQRDPGAWEEEFVKGLPTVNYTVVALGDDFSVEFDCGETFGVVNYCIHILSRSPTIDPAKFAELVHLTNETLGLNIHNLPYNLTKQDECWE